MPTEPGFGRNCPQCDTAMVVNGSWLRADGTRMRRFICKYCDTRLSYPSHETVNKRFNRPNPLKNCKNSEWRCWCIQMQVAWETGLRMEPDEPPH